MSKTAMQRELERIEGEPWPEFQEGSEGYIQQESGVVATTTGAVEDLLDAIYQDAINEDNCESYKQKLYESLEGASAHAGALLKKAQRRAPIRLHVDLNAPSPF